MSDIQTNTTTEAPEAKKPPVWKQLAGALGGAAIAFALYTTYQTAAPSLTAWVSIPWVTPRDAPDGKVAFVDPEKATSTQDRIAKRAKEIAARFAARPENEQAPNVRGSDALLKEEPVEPATDMIAMEENVPEAMTEPEPEPEVAPAAEPIDEFMEPEAPTTPAWVATDVAPVVAQTATSAPKTVAQKSQTLPSSGVGMWLAAIFALVGAIGWKYRHRLHEEIVSI